MFEAPSNAGCEGKNWCPAPLLTAIRLDQVAPYDALTPLRGHVTPADIFRFYKPEKVNPSFPTDVAHGDPQQVMARATGSYKRGNERTPTRRPRSS